MSEEIALAAGDLAYWQRRAEQAEAAAAVLKTAHADAWTLLGRCDFFLETFAAQPVKAQRRQAAQLRSEIEKASKP
jgi:hypothetical protein